MDENKNSESDLTADYASRYGTHAGEKTVRDDSDRASAEARQRSTYGGHDAYAKRFGSSPDNPRRPLTSGDIVGRVIGVMVLFAVGAFVFKSVVRHLPAGPEGGPGGIVMLAVACFAAILVMSILLALFLVLAGKKSQ
jgi:hypothetical protein